ncbi:hypothetical protein HU200_022195 [Digitaria exilis]|uniref:Uncharacterized protein n=1 Tax=Digitaria exilis TaxID=1010633 RepID=A0A835CB99_9POAL|nr:hypothetical protein HU200_022195 [Digitaria exilis]
MASLQRGKYTGGRRRVNARSNGLAAAAAGEAAAVEAEVDVEETSGAADAEAGRGEVGVRHAQLLPELRRRPELLPPPPVVDL